MRTPDPGGADRRRRAAPAHRPTRARLRARTLSGLPALLAIAALSLAALMAGAGARTLLERSAGIDPELLEGSGTGLILYVFQREDCDAVRGVVRALNEVSAAGGGQVVGVPIGVPAAELETGALLRSAGIDFPLRPELAPAARRLLLRLGQRHTPSVLLLDGLGRPLATLPAELHGPGAERATRALVELTALDGRYQRER